MSIPFRDRVEAGRALALQLETYAGRSDLIVLALPRGGVPVAYEVARALGAPLDVFTVRKLGVPGHPELALGAIATGGVRVIDEDVVRSLRVPIQVIDVIAARELRELDRREQVYRGNRPVPDVRGRTVILVDDGMATGSSMRAALAAVQRLRPARVIVAVPVAAPSTCRQLESEADECVCVLNPEPFHAVGCWYEDFSQTTDEEVRDLLERSAHQAEPEASNRCEESRCKPNPLRISRTTS